MKAVKKHAEQYITNIQLDIDEIDDEIEEILLQTEDANYNVAQGYKVFKRLKELRIERKEKEKKNWIVCMHLRIPLTALRLPTFVKKVWQRSRKLWKCSPQIIMQIFLSWKMSRKKYIL